MNENKYLVYCHIHRTSCKAYVGITKRSAKQRWKSGEGYKRQAFYKTIQEFGWDSFDHIILLDDLTQEEAEYFETFYIDYYDSYENGYNADFADGPIDALCGEYYRVNALAPEPIKLLQLYREKGTVDIELLDELKLLLEKNNH